MSCGSVDVGAVESAAFSETAVFTPAFVAKMNMCVPGVTAVQAAAIGGASNMAALDSYVRGMTNAAFKGAYGAIAAMSNNDVFAAAHVMQGDEVVLAAAKAAAKVVLAANYVIQGTGAPGAFANVLALPESDPAVLGSYTDAVIGGMSRSNDSFFLDASGADARLQEKTRGAEEVRLNLLTASAGDGIMRRQQMVGRAMFWAALVGLLLLAVGLTTAYLSGSWGAMYVTAIFIVVMVIAIQSSGVLYTMVTQW